MKKAIVLLLLFGLLVSLTACQTANRQDTTLPQTTEGDTLPPDSTDPTEGTTDGLALPQENLVAVAMPVTVESQYAEDGTELFTYAYQTMHLTVQDPEVANKIIIDYLGRLDKTALSSTAMAQQAKSDYTGSTNWVPYKLLHIMEPVRADQGVLSLYGQNISYSGASHAFQGCISASYDMVSGDVLTLGSILYHIDAKKDLCQLVIDTLAESDYVLYEDYKDLVTARFSVDESTDQAFYFTPYGLNFYFAPYEIAPFSSGTVVISIPYEKLPGILADAYFPSEKTNTEGQLTVSPFSGADLSDYSQFAELVITDDEEKLLLTTDGILQNITVQRFYDNLADIKDGIIIFRTNVLTPSDAIMLEDSVTDRDDILLTYENNGVITGKYLLKNPDGSFNFELAWK